VGFALSVGSTSLLILLVSGLLVFRSARRRELVWDPGEPPRMVEPMVRND
jgi:hypothetical protein